MRVATEKEIISFIDDLNKDEFKVFALHFPSSGNREELNQIRSRVNVFPIPMIRFQVAKKKTQAKEIERFNCITLNLDCFEVNIYSMCHRNNRFLFELFGAIPTKEKPIIKLVVNYEH